MGTSLFHKKTAACFVLRFFCAPRYTAKPKLKSGNCVYMKGTLICFSLLPFSKGI